MRINLPALALCLLLTTSAAAQETLWKVVAPPVLKEGWEAMRINTSTGQCCQSGDGKWTLVKEADAAPQPSTPGTYQAIIMWEQENDSYHSIRWNTKTGQSWQLDGDQWISFPGPAEKDGDTGVPENLAAIRVGAFAGAWGDPAQFTIDKVDEAGTFVGKATLTKGANAGYLIAFEGQLAADKSIKLSRTDKFNGITIAQSCTAPAPQLVNNAYLWKGVMVDRNQPDVEYSFELQIPAN